VRVAAVGIEALTVIVEAPIESAAHSSLEELVLASCCKKRRGCY
jgi:hypothetical protein